MKQTIVVRTDLGMGTGKLAAQVAHAAMRAANDADDRACHDWKSSGAAKVVLEADSADQLQQLADDARRAGVPSALVTDAGRTQLQPGTVTALGVGPAAPRDIDHVTGDLSLL